jgi:2-succinyl-5-enolpyruvyl-6-hydroxy-3-cyclohexene-1-carboxylate synthase
VATGRRGPTHVNLQLAEPLLPDRLPVTLPASATPPPAPPRRMRYRPDDAGPPLALGPRTVVVAGDDAGPPARFLAQQAEWPLLAEPTSGARTGTHAVRTGRLLLGTDLGEQVERVVVVGHPTLSRPVTRLISRDDIEVVAVRTAAGYATDPGRVARWVDEVPGVARGGDDERAWLAAWRDADRSVGAGLDELAAASEEARPLAVARAVADAVPPGGLLVIGSSQPVRDLDLMMTPYPAGERRLVLGNRGLAGIDGTVSSAVGAALGRSSSRALAYVGDVTFVHDLTGLVVGPEEPVPDLTIVVANDDGGAIFSTLEQGAAPYAAAFERVFGTPHGVAIGSWCEATGTAYERVDDVDRLAGLLAEQVVGLRVLEVPVDRRSRRALDEAVRSLG